MAFAMFCLLKDNESELSLKAIESQFKKNFSNDVGFEISYENHPFDKNEKNLLLSWGVWWARVFFEVGKQVEADSIEMSKFADANNRMLISLINKRFRILFGDDDDMIYTNHIICIMDFFEKRPDFIIFDPQKNTFENGIQ